MKDERNAIILHLTKKKWSLNWQAREKLLIEISFKYQTLPLRILHDIFRKTKGDAILAINKTEAANDILIEIQRNKIAKTHLMYNKTNNWLIIRKNQHPNIFIK